MKELRTYISEGILGNLDDIMGDVDAKVQKIIIMNFLWDIGAAAPTGAGSDPNKSVELKYNQDTGKYTAVVDGFGINRFNKLDLGYKIPENLESIDYTKITINSIVCVSESDEIDCSILSILKFRPDLEVIIMVPKSAKKLNLHNFNIKNCSIKVQPELYRDKTDTVNFCNDCDLSGVSCLNFSYMDLSDLKDLRGFKGKIETEYCISNENTDFRIRESCLHHLIPAEFDFTKQGILKCNEYNMNLKYQNITHDCGAIDIIANKITQMNINDLPLIKSAKEVFAAGFDGDINVAMPKDVGVEYMVVSWPQDNHGRMLNGFVKKVNYLRVFAKKLVLNLRLGTTDMKSIQSSCEELQFLNGNPICTSLTNTVNKNPNGAAIRWYDEKKFPNLKKICYSDNKSYLDCCIEKVEGSPNLWKLVHSK